MSLRTVVKRAPFSGVAAGASLVLTAGTALAFRPEPAARRAGTQRRPRPKSRAHHLGTHAGHLHRDVGSPYPPTRTFSSWLPGRGIPVVRVRLAVGCPSG
ncbi:hypothetical protein GCM10009780_42820 [Actinomadura alba]